MTDDPSNEERDDALGSMLRGRGVPDHGPDFWATVQDRITAETPQLVVLPKIGPEESDLAPQADSLHPDAIHDLPLAAALPPAKFGPVSGPGSVTQSRSARRPWAGVAAAAAVVLVALGFFAFSGDAQQGEIMVASELPSTPMPAPIPFEATPFGVYDMDSGLVVNETFGYSLQLPPRWIAQGVAVGQDVVFVDQESPSMLRVHSQVVAGDLPVSVPLIPGQTAYSETQVPVMSGLARADVDTAIHQERDILTSVTTGVRDGQAVSQLVAQWNADYGESRAVVMELVTPDSTLASLDDFGLAVFTVPGPAFLPEPFATPGYWPSDFGADLALTPVPFELELVPSPTPAPAFSPGGPSFGIPVDADSGDQLVARDGDLYIQRADGTEEVLYHQFMAPFDPCVGCVSLQRWLINITKVEGTTFLIVREFTSGPGPDGELVDALFALDLHSRELRTLEERRMTDIETMDWFYTGHVSSDGTDFLVERSLWQGACGWLERLSPIGEPVPWPDNPAPGPDMTTTPEEVATMWEQGTTPEGCAVGFDGNAILQQYDVPYLQGSLRNLESALRGQSG